MKLSNSIYFDDQTGEFIAEKFYIDGNEVCEDDYEAMLDEFDEVNSEEEVMIDENCECDSECCMDCEYNTSDECDCPECTLDKFTELIQEITGGCPGCIREILADFMFEIIDHIIIEDAEETAPEYIN